MERKNNNIFFVFFLFCYYRFGLKSFKCLLELIKLTNEAVFKDTNALQSMLIAPLPLIHVWKFYIFSFTISFFIDTMSRFVSVSHLAISRTHNIFWLAMFLVLMFFISFCNFWPVYVAWMNRRKKKTHSIRWHIRHIIRTHWIRISVSILVIF